MDAKNGVLLRNKVRSPIWALVTTQFTNEYGAKSLSEKLGLGKKARFVYLYLGLLAVAFIPVVGLLYSFAKVLAAQSVMLGQPGLPVILAVTAGQSMVVFVGISGIMSILYYSDDLETLQAMPFSPRQIMLAKVAVAHVGAVLVTSVVVLPFLVALGRQLALLGYWLPVLPVLLAVPAIPQGLAVLVVVFIMRVTGRSKKRDFFRVIFGLLFFVVIMVFQYVNMNMTRHGPEQMMQAIMERNGLIQAIAGFYPPLKWAAWALTGDTLALRLGGIFLFVGGSIGFLAGISLLAERWFLGGISRGIGKVAAGPGALKRARKAAVSAPVAFGGRGRSPVLAVFWREHRMLTRTPNFVLTALINLAIVPIMVVVSSFSAGAADVDLLAMLRSAVSKDFIILGAVAVHGLMVSLNQVSSTSVSREGAMFWSSKAIPVSPAKQVRGKVLYGLAYSLVQLAILIVALVLLLKMNVTDLLWVALLGMLVSWPVTAICLMNDLLMPKLKWTNPQQAMKGNLGALVASVLSAAYLALFYFVVRFAYPRGVTGLGLYGTLGFLLIITGFFLQRILDSFAVSRYKAIEV